ncbi:phage portal protein [Eubacterium sp.]|jgi:HK97 family phage portal protein|uniref:phage portal protein n=1 Tax=Eubacterium TaxID=1730 RepID=UPI0039968095
MAFRLKIRDFFGKKNNVITSDFIEQEVITQMSYKLLAVHIAASYIANAISKCEIKIFKKENEKIKLQKDVTGYRLNVEPNNNQSGSQFWNKVAMKMLTNKDGALVIVSNEKLYVADSFHVDKKPFLENEYSAIVIDDFSSNKKYVESEVMHFQLEDKNVNELIDSMYADYGEAISYAVKSFLQSNGQKYKLQIENDKVGDQDFEDYYKEKVEKSLEKFVKSPNGIYIQFPGNQLDTMNVSKNIKDSADVIKLRNDIFEVVAHAYKIPISMMAGNINNMKEIISAFITFAVEPIATLISDEIKRKFFGYSGYMDDVEVKVDTSTIPYISILDNATNAAALIQNTLFNSNEVREILGAIPGEEEILNKFFVTKNNSLAEDVLNGTAGEETTNGKEK